MLQFPNPQIVNQAICSPGINNPHGSSECKCLPNPPRCLTISSNVSSLASPLLSARRLAPHRCAPHKCVHPNLVLLKIVSPDLVLKIVSPDLALKIVFPNLVLKIVSPNLALKIVSPDLALKIVFPNLVLKILSPNLAPPNPVPKTSNAAILPKTNIQNVIEMPSTGGVEKEGRRAWGFVDLYAWMNFFLTNLVNSTLGASASKHHDSVCSLGHVKLSTSGQNPQMFWVAVLGPMANIVGEENLNVLS
ncbi:hypothetical protein NXF25_018353 [Crotalus adamanteus]|uniref:Uncharacterized protein n=1 Tax=Crotalus adamanteus TaxID=8729 RepID=A0AAW1AM87_CROAD